MVILDLFVVRGARLGDGFAKGRVVARGDGAQDDAGAIGIEQEPGSGLQTQALARGGWDDNLALGREEGNVNSFQDNNA